MHEQSRINEDRQLNTVYYCQRIKKRLNTSQNFHFRHQQLNPFLKSYSNAFKFIQSTPPSILSTPKMSTISSTIASSSKPPFSRSLNSSLMQQSKQSTLPNLNRMQQKLKLVIKTTERKTQDVKMQFQNLNNKTTLIPTKFSSFFKEPDIKTEQSPAFRLENNQNSRRIKTHQKSRSQDVIILEPSRTETSENFVPQSIFSQISLVKNKNFQQSTNSLIDTNQIQSLINEQKSQRQIPSDDIYILEPPNLNYQKSNQKRKKIYIYKNKNSFKKFKEPKNKINDTLDSDFSQSSKAFVHKVNQIFQSQHTCLKQRDSEGINKLNHQDQSESNKLLTLETSLIIEQDGINIFQKMKSQFTSPRLTLQNQLSVIPPQQQQVYSDQLTKTRTRTMSSLKVIMEAIAKGKDENQRRQSIEKTIAKDRVSMNICVLTPTFHEQEPTEKFFVPGYYKELELAEGVRESQDEEQQDLRQRNKMKQAIQQFMIQKKTSQRYSCTILKMITLEDSLANQSNPQQRDSGIFVSSKVRRYLKLYLQNKLQKMLQKVEVKIILFLQSLNERRNIYLMPLLTLSAQQSYDYTSVATSRMLSGLSMCKSMYKFQDVRQQSNIQLIRFKAQVFDRGVKYDAVNWKKYIIDQLVEEKRSSLFIQPKKISTRWVKSPMLEHNTLIYSQSDLSDSVTDENQDFFDENKAFRTKEISWNELSCGGLYKNLEILCLPIISEVDDFSRNTMLNRTSIQKEDNITIQSLLQDDQLQSKFIQVGFLFNSIKKYKILRVNLTLLEKYKEVLNGLYEDFSEISGMNAQYGLLAFEELPLKIIVQSSKQLMMRQSSSESTKITQSKQSLALKPNLKPQASRNQLDINLIGKEQIRSYSRRSPTCIILNPKTHHEKTPKATPSAADSPSINLTPLIQLQNQLSLNSNESFQVFKKKLDEVSNSNTTEEKSKERYQFTQKQTTMTSIKQSNDKDGGRQNIIQQRNDLLGGENFRNSTRSRQISMAQFSLQMRTHVLESIRRQTISQYKQISLLVLENKFTEMEELLQLNPNLQVNEKDDDGNTYLIIAAQSGFTEIVRLLLEKGAGVNLQNNHGDTPLHKALMFHNYGVADLLINAGALQNIRNFDNQSPWQNIK